MQQLRLADAENRSLQDKIDRKRHGIATLCFSLCQFRIPPDLQMHSCLLPLLLVHVDCRFQFVHACRASFQEHTTEMEQLYCSFAATEA